MSLEKQRVATYADIEALPPNMVGQILYGVLYAQPRPAAGHARASSVLGTLLTGHFDLGVGGPGGWILLDEPELHLGDHILVPDIAGWRKANFPASATPATPYLETAPDWVCEVLSPSTRQIDRTDKLTIYADNGVGHAWYVDPAAQTLEVFTPERSAYQITQTFKKTDEISAPPFAGYAFSLGRLWLQSSEQSEKHECRPPHLFLAT